MDYAGFYINLDRSPERRAEMDAHLAEAGLAERYRRFSASDGNALGFPGGLRAGEMGCFTSHYRLLKENFDTQLPIHVVEDDVLFSRFTVPVIDSLVAKNSFDVFDIVYLDTFVQTFNALYKRYHEIYRNTVRRGADGNVEAADFQLIDLANVEFASTSSMVIGPRAINKLHNLYAAELAKGAELPIDLFIRRKVQEGVLRAGCIFPFVTSLRLESVMGTTITGRELHLPGLATVIARHAFFIDADWKKCLDYAVRYLDAPPDDLQRQVLTHILGFSLDDRFQFI